MAVLDECTPWVKIDSMISAMIFFCPTDKLIIIQLWSWVDFRHREHAVMLSKA